MTRFLVDEMCGRLVNWLRILGFDTEYVGNLPGKDRDTAALAKAILEQRILVTRDKTLIARARELGVKVVIPVESKDIVEVLTSVLAQVGETPPENPTPRCPHCNGELIKVDKDEVAALVPPRALEVYDTFFRCRRCGHVYWHGSHWRFINYVIREVRRRLHGRTSDSSQGAVLSAHRRAQENR